MTPNGSTLTINVPSGWEGLINKVTCIDCLEGMKQMPDRCVDLVVTDPWYGIGKADEDLNYPYGFEGECFRVAPVVVIMPGLWAMPLCLLAMGHRYKSIIAGHNKNGMTFSPIGFGNWIPAVVGGDFKKPGPDAFDFVISEQKPPHPSPKPIEYMLKLIDRVSNPGDLILDPFMGSGTTAVACKQLGRRFIGFEINPAYVDICNQRLAQGVLGLKAEGK